MSSQALSKINKIELNRRYGGPDETPELVILDYLAYRLVKTTKRLTFDIIWQDPDPNITWYGDDDGEFYTFRASNGYEVISRSVMDIQTERVWLLGASKEDRAFRSGSMVFGNDEKRDRAYEAFHQALREWNDHHYGLLN